jgi:radical SAM protein with 4Fe4S-binding SPASM domain
MIPSEELISYSKLKSKTRISLEENIPLDFPLVLFVDPCDLCQLRCPFCPQHNSDFYKFNKGEHFLSIRLWEKLFGEIANSGKILKSLNLYGLGEPLLNPNLEFFMKNAGLIAERITISTNGLELSSKWWDFFEECDPFYLRISVYLNTFDRIIEALGKRGSGYLQYHRPFIYAKLFLTKGETENRLFRLFKPLVHEVAFEEFHKWNHPGSVFVAKKIHDYTEPNVCAYPFYSLFIRSNGLVSACCADWNMNLIIGDFNNQSLSEIWNGKKLRSFLKLMISSGRSKIGSCHSCSICFDQRDKLSVNPELGKLFLP